MSAPTITVVVITYNYGRFIEKAIDSVLAQEFPQERVEIVVVDDGSTDDTRERVSKYGSRVQYFYKANGGQASALNLGIAKASGEIITFLDADDWFLPGRLARVVEAFRGDPGVGMVYHQIQEWHERTAERRDWDFVAVSGDLHKEPEKFVAYLTPPNLAISFRRKALSGLLPIPEGIRMLADCYIAALSPFVMPVLAIPEVLAIYRIHGNNSHYTCERRAPIETRRNKVRMWQIVIAAMREWLANRGYTRKLAPVRSLQDHWTIILEREEFEVKAPGRARYFRHLLRCYRRQLPLMTWKLMLINGLHAVTSTAVGYERARR
jgi:glycosyltransferase involved in cell wall biosynthesis